MKKTRQTIKQKWDEKIALLLSITFEKFEEEFLEHGSFLKWVFRFVLIPASFFFLLIGILFEQNLASSILMGFLVFLYSNFVPDLDSLLHVSKDPHKTKKTKIEKIALLCLGPLFVYYLLSGQAKPIYAEKPKEFHQSRYLAIYAVFLFIAGLLIWQHPLKSVVFSLFGSLGFATHLTVDGHFSRVQAFILRKITKTTPTKTIE